jgi:hypothetical protein
MQMCHRELDEKFFRPLASGEQLSANYVGELMRGIRAVRGDDAELCNKLFPDTGDFMDPAEQRAIIRADFSDAEIARRLKKQKAYFKRLSRLLPALLGFLKKKQPDTLIPILRIMDDFHHDYHYVAHNKRRDKNKREMIDSLNKAANAVTTALSAMRKAETHFSIDFDIARRKYHELVFNNEPTYFGFEELLRELELCRCVLKFVSFRTNAEDDFKYISHNQIKTHVVEYAYNLSICGDGPKLITTPGSDFSVFCGLLNEIAGGIPDDSLSGAINRYARSKERKNHDEEEAKFIAENSEDKNLTNNFKEAADLVERLTTESYRLIEVLKSDSADEDVRFAAKMLLAANKKEMETAINRYGPNIVWLSQASENSGVGEGALSFDFDASQRRLRELDIELGQTRRRSREN